MRIIIILLLQMRIIINTIATIIHIYRERYEKNSHPYCPILSIFSLKSIQYLVLYFWGIERLITYSK